jgi:hypothetical protein
VPQNLAWLKWTLPLLNVAWLKSTVPVLNVRR